MPRTKHRGEAADLVFDSTAQTAAKRIAQSRKSGEQLDPMFFREISGEHYFAGKSVQDFIVELADNAPELHEVIRNVANSDVRRKCLSSVAQMLDQGFKSEDE